MANNPGLRRTGGTAALALALALLSASISSGAARAEAAAAGDLRNEIGTIDTQIALHLSPDDIVAMQKGLIRLGLLVGDADGAFDDRTQAALAARQRARGLAPTGRLGSLQWAALRKTAEAYPTTSSAEIGTVDTEAALALLPSDIAALQIVLLRLRLLRQAATGEFDGATRSAIASWQRTSGYAPTTYLGFAQLAALRGALTAPKLVDVRGEIGTIDSQSDLGLTSGEIKTVQDRLCALKFLRGPISASFDAPTRSALMAWQKSEQVAATGYLGPLQFETLLASPPRAPGGVLSTPCSGEVVSARTRYRVGADPVGQIFHGMGVGIGFMLVNKLH